jgi:urease alpha subunit
MGDPNAAIPTVQPIYGRPMWAFTPGGAALSSITWASQLSIDSGGFRSSHFDDRILNDVALSTF